MPVTILVMGALMAIRLGGFIRIRQGSIRYTIEIEHQGGLYEAIALRYNEAGRPLIEDARELSLRSDEMVRRIFALASAVIDTPAVIVRRVVLEDSPMYALSCYGLTPDQWKAFEQTPEFAQAREERYKYEHRN